jgi:large subunit ribosomal protein L4
METKVYNQKGKEVGNIALPESIFGLPWNADLVHQTVVAMQANARTPVAHTKTRGEVRGGGKKPWKQKGTGRARHGSTRSPIWIGGGITHGPRNDKDYSQKVNKKMKVKALYTVLSEKVRKGEVLFVEDISTEEIKTKKAVEIMNLLGNVSGFERLKGSKKVVAHIAMDAVSTEVRKVITTFLMLK